MRPLEDGTDDLVPRAAVGRATDERVDEADERHTRRSERVADRCATARGVPAVHSLLREPHAPEIRDTRRELHARGRRLEDFRSPVCVEGVVASEEPGERLTVITVADEVIAGVGRDPCHDAGERAATTT